MSETPEFAADVPIDAAIPKEAAESADEEVTPAEEPPAEEAPEAASCTAITKAGTQCKLPAEPGSETCHMHGAGLDEAPEAPYVPPVGLAHP